MSNGISLSYPAKIVHDGDRDLFLLGLFIPPDCRESLYAIYAFDLELAHVHHVVSEELNAHIRYAWWQESIDMIAEGKPPRAQPVVQAIAPLLQNGDVSHADLSALIFSYRSSYPEIPADNNIEKIASVFIEKNCAQAKPAWQKAAETIKNHRIRYDGRMNIWLHLKLIMLGVF